MTFDRRLRAALAALLLTFFGTIGAYGAVDRAICSASDTGGTSCTAAQLKTNANEEVNAVDTRAPMVLGSVSGTNTITASVTPTLTAYANGQSFWLKPANNITGATTLNINSIGAKTLANAAGTAVGSGDVLAANIYLVTYYATGDQFRIVTAIGSGAGADAGLAYITQANTASLSAERALTAGTAIGLTDGGANSTMTVAVNDAELLSIAGLTSAADKLPYFTGSGTASLADFSAFARTILDDAAATNVRTTLGLAIGTDVQAFDADLSALAANSTDGLWAHTGAGTGSARTLTAPAAGFTITNPAGIAGNPTFVLANDLSALEGLGSTGIGVRSAADTWVQRSVAAGAGIAVTNGDGVSGNPTAAFDYSDQGASPSLAADACQFTSNATVGGVIVCEGDTADAFETRIAVTDPTADRLFTIPNADSNAVQPTTCSGTDKVSGISSAGVVTCGADAGAGGGIGNVVEDLTPQLGGDLDTNGKAIEFGTAATDTTVVRSGAGDLTVEGNVIYRAGGTDVAIADGGTGQSTASAGFDALSPNTTQGDLTYRNATGNVRLPTGTNGQVLTSGGAAANLSWTTVSGAATPDVQSFTSTGAGTWTKPSGGQKMCMVEVWAAGGSGGKGRAASAAGGGGGGQYLRKLFVMSSLGATEATSVGTGGAGQTTADTNGNVGGNTTFGSGGTLVTAYGGGGGGADNSSATGVAGGGNGGGPNSAGGTQTQALSATYAVANFLHIANEGAGGRTASALDGEVGVPTVYNGAGGGSPSSTATNVNAAGGNSVYGGAGGGSGAEDAAPGPGAGGTSTFGGAGGAGAFDASTATSGSQPGGGGGGSETGTSGAGGDGKVVVTCW